MTFDLCATGLNTTSSMATWMIPRSGRKRKTTGMDKNSCSLGKLFLLVLANQTPQPHNTTTINISVQHSLIDNIESFGSLLVVGDPECKEISDCFLPQTSFRSSIAWRSAVPLVILHC